MKQPAVGSNVVFYIRCSTPKQIESIGQQRGILMRRAQELGVRVVGEYKDAGISGQTIEQRDDLQRLFRDAAAGKFKYVFIHDVSRLARGGTIAFGWIVRELRMRGVAVFCCKARKIITEDEAIRFAQEADQARAENKSRAYNALRGNIASVWERRSDPGRRLYGFDRCYLSETGEPFQQVRVLSDGSKLVLDPKDLTVTARLGKSERYAKVKGHRVVLVPGQHEHIVVVQRIFDLLRTMAPPRVADTLNREGIPGPTGGKWIASTIREIAQNPTYCGHTYYNKRHECTYYSIRQGEPCEIESPEEGQVVVALNPREEWLVRPDTHAPIIAQALFEEVQRTFEQRRHSAVKSVRGRKRTYLLGGMVFCKRCGQRLHGQTLISSQAKGRRPYPRYTCSSARKYGKSTCAHYGIPADAMEQFCLARVRKLLSSPKALSSLREGIERELREGEDRAGQVKMIRGQLTDLESRKANLFSSLTPEMAEFFKPQIVKLMQEEKTLKDRLAAAEISAPAIDKKAALAQALDLYKSKVLMLEGTCRESIREVFRVLGLRLDYDPDRKEGRLSFDPFGQLASRKAQPPMVA